MPSLTCLWRKNFRYTRAMRFIITFHSLLRVKHELLVTLTVRERILIVTHHPSFSSRERSDAHELKLTGVCWWHSTWSFWLILCLFGENIARSLSTFLLLLTLSWNRRLLDSILNVRFSCLLDLFFDEISLVYSSIFDFVTNFNHKLLARDSFILLTFFRLMFSFLFLCFIWFYNLSVTIIFLFFWEVITFKIN